MARSGKQLVVTLFGVVPCIALHRAYTTVLHDIIIVSELYDLLVTFILSSCYYNHVGICVRKAHMGTRQFHVSHWRVSGVFLRQRLLVGRYMRSKNARLCGCGMQ
ncbi:hypothetical protein DFJ58DRAFT_762098 [Suillus subalutaceus]|uniref:uncharacterized protein n=1 Tax=Suillus subalutaceus TaxID=48586 RepID=UPI001B87051C|nr:uncharacterized protein DFJ58DRAFT_762098 [Suillus subalutaceus]KAG1871729.1 hypothetical protein DFJ58DRAFT_762098 [Suillus subalutaceus]